MRKLFCAVTGAGLLATTPVLAETGSGWGAGARLSTLGYGVEVTRAITPQLDARLGFNTLSRSDSRTEDGIKYDADLNLRSTNLLLDWRPFENGFRMSAGYLLSGNEIDLQGEGTGQTVTIGGVSGIVIDSDNRLNGDVDLNSGAYLGIGYGAGARKGWSFTADLGVVFQGKPDVSLTASQSLRDAITAAGGDPDTELNREESDLQDDLDEFDRYPVIAIGASYGF